MFITYSSSHAFGVAGDRSLNHPVNVTLRQATSNDSEFVFQIKRAAFKYYVEEALGWDENRQRERHESRFSSQSFRIIQVSDIDVGIVALAEEQTASS